MGIVAELFYHSDADQSTLHRRIVPSQEQHQYFQDKWQELADHLKSYLAEVTGFPISTWIQGSYKFGTQVRPASMDGEIDIDLGVYFEWSTDESEEPKPEDIKDCVQEALLDFSNREPNVRMVADPPKERCCRIHYKKQFYIDLPTYHLDPEKDERRLATENHGWEYSDPKALVIWFQEKVGNPERHQLRRIVRYLKIWAALFAKEVDGKPPSSILLTVLATEAWFEIDQDAVDGDDECLFQVASLIYARLEDTPEVENPVDISENLNRLDETESALFMRSLSEFVTKAKDALEAEHKFASAVIWADLFQHFFPMPEDMEDTSSDSLPAVISPEIEVLVTDENTGRNIGKYENVVPKIPKGCSLKFRITNPDCIPIDSNVEWIVRNNGDEAGSLNDLGHKQSGPHQLTAEEKSRYHGTHYMDCFIRRNGRVLSARRVPVPVQRFWRPRRNPKRPDWVRFRKKKK